MVLPSGCSTRPPPTLPSNPMTDSRVSEAVAMASNGAFAGAAGDFREPR
jgi:hypothetical protein